jgi:hypothetical protein
MATLQEEVIAAHGGLQRWGQFSSVRAHLVNGGIVWGLKGQAGVIDDSWVRVDLHRQFAGHSPIGEPGTHSVFRGDYVAIEDEDGKVLEERSDPKESFSDHTLETPWDRLQLAYFAGEAMWTYLTAPFAFAMPGFRSEELAPWEERGENWRRLKVTYPEGLATHCREQVFYFGADGLLRRHDYTAEVIKAGPAAQYVSAYEEVDGIMIPTKRRVYASNPDGSFNAEPLLVSIDLDRIAFE